MPSRKGVVEEDSRTVILIDDGGQRLADVLAVKGYGVVHLAARDASPRMLAVLISGMCMSKRKTALIADVSREEADIVATAIWGSFPDVRVVVVDGKAKQVQIGIGNRCDMTVPDDLMTIFSALKSYQTPA